MSVAPGSTSTAARSARANALNDASTMWCPFVPASIWTWSVSFAAPAIARKNSSARSVSKPSIAPAGSSPSKTHSGRPEMSMTAVARASSIGTVAWP